MLLIHVVEKASVQMLEDHAVVSAVIKSSVDPDDAALVLVQVFQPEQVIYLQKHRLVPDEHARFNVLAPNPPKGFLLRPLSLPVDGKTSCS